MNFETADLLNKWGFGDGDMLYDFKVEHGLKVIAHTLLVEVVKRHVLPELRKHHRIEVTIVPGLHNPIRLTEVDGIAVDAFDHGEFDQPTIQLSPETVEVSDDVILGIASEPQLIAEQAEEDQAVAEASAQADMSSQYGPLLEALQRRLQRQTEGLNKGEKR